jgi:hypothetical protein
MRTNGVNGASAVLQQRALDVLGDVFERGQWRDLFRMSRQTNHQSGNLASREMAANMVSDQEDLVGEDIDAERAANSAALTASQLHSSLLDDPAVERIDKGERHLGSVIKLFRSEGAGDVFREFLDRVFGHLALSLTPCS